MNNVNSALTEAVYYILLALQQPLHGYGIMQQTSTLSKGRLSLSAGTLYGALSNLLEKVGSSLMAIQTDRKEGVSSTKSPTPAKRSWKPNSSAWKKWWKTGKNTY
jgi:Transcriptional regulator PadR-like family.